MKANPERWTYCVLGATGTGAKVCCQVARGEVIAGEGIGHDYDCWWY